MPDDAPTTCESCGRRYSHPPDWPGSSTDDGLCSDCREALAEWEWALKQEDVEMERENPPPIKCDYCGRVGGGLNPVDPLRGWLAWIIWVATGRMSCGSLGCYSRAKRESETAVAEMSDARTA